MYDRKKNEEAVLERILKPVQVMDAILIADVPVLQTEQKRSRSSIGRRCLIFPV